MARSYSDIEEEFHAVGGFARHETFHPRFGWLKKGFDAASLNPDIFVREDATVRLGVGKNMVRAIRYWCTAFKVLDEVPNAKNPRLRDCVPTSLGEKLLGDAGWDPYLETTSSLLLLHWNLLRRPCRAPAWHAVFNNIRAPEFTRDQLLREVLRFKEVRESWSEVVDASIKKDIDCLLRMYAGARAASVSEDSLDSPFVELGLIRQGAGELGHYSFTSASRDGSPLIVAFACLDFMVTVSAASTISLRRLAYEGGSPGLIFRLTETDLAQALDEASRSLPTLRITHVGGMKQLVCEGDPVKESTRALRRQFRTSRGARI